MTTTPPDQLNSTPSPPNVPDTNRGAFIASREDAPAYWFYGTLWVVLADVHQTGGSYTVMEQWMRGGIGPASHVHNVDEWFFVLEGSMDMQVDGREMTAKPGDSIWIPRGTDHGFTTTDEGAHVLNGYAPGGVEQIIVGLATPAARRELPPEDLALPSEDVLTRMNNNYWSASSDSGWSKIAPQR
jgi:mannose-6-phosphate isomerase-like protein (cupin superfamily)